MMKREDLITMKAIAICYKPFLKPEEALIYCNLGRTQLARKLSEYCIYKTNTGYYKKEELDKMMLGLPSQHEYEDSQLKLKFSKGRHGR